VGLTMLSTQLATVLRPIRPKQAIDRNQRSSIISKKSTNE
jgi:hypothetical protein